MKHKPVVLCLSGHDPCGGAGIQADIEVINSHSCHPASLITCLTQQDTHNVINIWPQPVEHFMAQATSLIQDLDVNVIKIGLIGSVDLAMAIVQIIRSIPHIPVVLDPVLAAGGGKNLSHTSLLNTLVEQLIPHVTLLTPNSQEARLLSGKNSLGDAASVLQDMGAKYVLITGSHEETATVDNTLYMPDKTEQIFHWERLPGQYHGSGCTLASACAALLARGFDVYTAVSEAQDFTWQALENAYQTGSGQLNPDRMFWCEA